MKFTATLLFASATALNLKQTSGTATGTTTGDMSGVAASFEGIELDLYNAINEHAWGGLDEATFELMGQYAGSDWENWDYNAVWQLGEDFKNEFRDEWGWIWVQSADAVAWLSGKASQEVAENAIAQLEALGARRQESWYWDAYSDGSRAAWIWG